MTREKKVDFSLLPDGIKAFAFLEELLVGGDFGEFLSTELAGKKDNVKEFFAQEYSKNEICYKCPDVANCMQEHGKKCF